MLKAGGGVGNIWPPIQFHGKIFHKKHPIRFKISTSLNIKIPFLRIQRDI